MALNLNPEQIQAARAKALEMRRARAELLTGVADGRLDPVDMLHASTDPTVAGIRVARLVRAVPGYGKIRAERLMATAGINARRRVAGLGTRQRAALADALRGV
ncbi:MAG: integration host factor, actinobacterial type [Streptosporangiales bacterium]